MLSPSRQGSGSCSGRRRIFWWRRRPNTFSTSWRAQGKAAGEGEVRQSAEKRLSANEAFICNPASGACLTIDFSPLRPDESPPSRRAVALSAKYAAEGLAEEEGVTDLLQENRPVSLAGAETVYRVDARFRQNGEPCQFIGLIGFIHPHWFFLYYSDRGRDSGDSPDMERLLKTLTIRR